MRGLYSRPGEEREQERERLLWKKRGKKSRDLVRMENNGSIITWVGSTVSSAFFSSLERFSCVNVATSDPNDDDDDDYSSTTSTPTSATTTTTSSQPSSVQVNNDHTTNDVSNLPV
ncbi:hypothetical protein RJT34_02760 [Clitoria ternatea]|uniref:Uncharacterized protein n=1 Tax=Clitoria ternatea TaxID=43366 RepID=A0AAN9Q143_CLITE